MSRLHFTPSLTRGKFIPPTELLVAPLPEQSPAALQPGPGRACCYKPDSDAPGHDWILSKRRPQGLTRYYPAAVVRPDVKWLMSRPRHVGRIPQRTCQHDGQRGGGRGRQFTSPAASSRPTDPGFPTRAVSLPGCCFLCTDRVPSVATSTAGNRVPCVIVAAQGSPGEREEPSLPGEPQKLSQRAAQRL